MAKQHTAAGAVPRENGDVLRFSGPPRRVQALVPHAAEALTRAPVTIEIEETTLAVPALAVPAASGHTVVRLVPAQPLPPGRHRGQLTAGEMTWEAEVEVLGATKLRAFPSRLDLEGSGGREVDVLVDLVNVGH